MRKLSKCMLLFLLGVLCSGTLFGAEKKIKKTVRAPAADLRVFNPQGISKEKNQGGEVVSARDLYLWGRTVGLFLLPDRGPLKDNRAAVIHRDGTVLALNNLNPGKSYTLYIDLVAFRNPDGREISSRLQVSVRSDMLKEALLADIPFSEVRGDSPVVLAVPYIYTHTGNIEVILRERSNRKSTWAIWDIIVTTADKLPPAIKVKNPVLIKKPVIKKKKALVKKKILKKKALLSKKKKKSRKAAAMKKSLFQKKKPVKKKSTASKKKELKKPLEKKKIIKKKNPEKKLEIRRPSKK